MTIRDWPLDERPREKLLTRGAAALSDAELLAVFLGSGVRGQSAVELGRDLLRRHAGLRGLLDRTPAALMADKGLGPARVARLLAAMELASRHLAATLECRHGVNDPVRAGDYFRARLRGYPHEVFACLFMDNHHRMIAFEELFRGSIDGAEVHPREVVRRCIAHNAAAVILGHNHPSGIAEASAADIAVTRRLREALLLIDVRVLDHFIVGEGLPVSFAARGWL
jgi:DNA repair protein RadC